MAEQTTEEKGPWQYTPSNPSDSQFGPAPNGGMSAPSTPSSAKPDSVSWSAAEYIDHQRSLGWYMMLALATVALTAGVYLLTKEYFAAGTIAMLGVIVGVFAAHKPQQTTYTLTDSGLQVGNKPYSFSLFKSFAVIKDGEHNSLNFIPLKRFMSPVSAAFNAADEQRIINLLSEYLPYEERQPDGIDRLTRRLRL